MGGFFCDESVFQTAATELVDYIRGLIAYNRDTRRRICCPRWWRPATMGTGYLRTS